MHAYPTGWVQLLRQAQQQDWMLHSHSLHVQTHIMIISTNSYPAGADAAPPAQTQCCRSSGNHRLGCHHHCRMHCEWCATQFLLQFGGAHHMHDDCIPRRQGADWSILRSSSTIMSQHVCGAHL